MTDILLQRVNLDTERDVCEGRRPRKDEGRQWGGCFCDPRSTQDPGRQAGAWHSGSLTASLAQAWLAS